MNRALDFAYTAEGQERVTCPRCKGVGEIYDPFDVGPEGEPRDSVCGACDQWGEVSRYWATRYRKEWW